MKYSVGKEMRWGNGKRRVFKRREKKIKRMKEELKKKVFFKRFGKRAKKFCFFRRASKICFYLVDPASDICLFKGLSHANLKEVQIEFLCGMLCKSAKMKWRVKKRMKVWITKWNILIKHENEERIWIWKVEEVSKFTKNDLGCSGFQSFVHLSNWRMCRGHWCWWRIRRIRVWFRRGSMRNRYYTQG